jgi:hypothetical protein
MSSRILLISADPQISMGLKPICYISAGSAENWRPDFQRFPKASLGKSLDGWPGEFWLDIRRADVSAIERLTRNTNM